MEENNLWSRRKFSKAAFSFQVLLASGLLNTSIGCAPKEDKKEGAGLGPSSQKLLKLAMDEIIPRADNMPAASEVGGLEYILKVLNEYPDLREGFKQLLSTLNVQSRDSSNDDFQNLQKEPRISILKQFEKEHSDLFSVLRDFVYESYYINEQVWKLVGYEPYPTLSAGPEMEPFDEAILERVKQMSSFYLNV